MSVAIEDQHEATLPVALQHSQDAQSDMGDGSSSLSDIEQEPEQDDEQYDLDDLESDVGSEEEENDSEAETERLDNSPNKQRAHKDVVLNSHTETHTFERVPTNLHNQYGAEEEDEEDYDEDNNNQQDDISDDELSLPDSPKTATGEAVTGVAHDSTAAKALSEEPPAEPKDIMHAFDLTNKKRKRSQLLDRDSVDAADLGEPLKKRTGSVAAPAEDFAIDDNASARGDVDTPNPISGDLSDAESVDGQQEEDEEAEHPNKKEKLLVDGEVEDHMDISEDSRSRKRRRKSSANGISAPKEEVAEPSDKHAAKKPTNTSDEGEDAEDNAEMQGDDAEAALRDEEERGYTNKPLSIPLTKLTTRNRGEKAHCIRAIERYRETFFII